MGTLLAVVLAAAPGQPKALRDADITQELRMILIDEAVVPGTLLTIETRGGHVTLFGPVPSKRSAERAVSLARRAPGVRSVHSELQVVGPAGAEPRLDADPAIRAGVERRLRPDSRFGEVRVQVAAGVVRLAGPVPDATAASDAARLAAGVPGVTRVVPDLEVATELARARP